MNSNIFLKIFRFFFPSRTESLYYLTYGEKPTLLNWYVIRFTGHVRIIDSKIVYFQPFWLFKVLKKLRKEENNDN